MFDANFINRYSFCYNDSEYWNWFGTEKNALSFGQIIKWKGLHRRKDPLQYQKIWVNGVFHENYVKSFSLVTRAFLYHLDKPQEYPIFDRLVWLVMRKQDQSNNLPKHTEDWNKYIKHYVPFFNDLFSRNKMNIHIHKIDNVDIEIVKRRMIDRALWEFSRVDGKY